MKITSSLLRSRTKRSLDTVVYLDLTDLAIVDLEKLRDVCPKLQILNLQNNNIDYISDSLETCTDLWKLDLSNNKVGNVEGLSRFAAFGTLILSNNNITWPELLKLRNTHILDLSLHGNPELDKDPLYRLHVIDCLPHVWMLDGKIITSAERVQVQHFFQDSALSEHPVRQKHGHDKFFPTSRKRLEINGVYGCRTEHWMRRFPMNSVLNVDVDRRRVQYLAYNIQQDLIIESGKRGSVGLIQPTDFLERLLEARQGGQRIQSNMLLLLLAASLEYKIPTNLMLEVLHHTKLHTLNDVETMDMFLLPREIRLTTVCIMLSAVKVDKDIGEDGGVYDKLYLCLYNLLADLLVLSRRLESVHATNTSFTLRGGQDGLRSLLACEVVQLLCIVPSYFEYITKDAGVMNLTSVAAGDVTIIMKLTKLVTKMEHEGWEMKRVYETISNVVLTEIQHNTHLVMNSNNRAAINAYVLNTRKALPRRPTSSPIIAADFLTTGRHSPARKPERIINSSPMSRPATATLKHTASLGDRVLLGPQNIGRVISVPEAHIVLVQMDQVPADSGAMITNSVHPDEHFAYLDLNCLYFDGSGNYWRPQGTVGDRITIQREMASTVQEPPVASHPPILLSTMQEKTGSMDKSQEQGPSDRTSTLSQAPPPNSMAPTDAEELDGEMPVSARLKKEFRLKLDMEQHSSKKLLAPDSFSRAPPPSQRPRSALGNRGQQQKRSLFSDDENSQSIRPNSVDLDDGEDGSEEDEILFRADPASCTDSLGLDDAKTLNDQNTTASEQPTEQDLKPDHATETSVAPESVVPESVVPESQMTATSIYGEYESERLAQKKEGTTSLESSSGNVPPSPPPGTIRSSCSTIRQVSDGTNGGHKTDAKPGEAALIISPSRSATPGRQTDNRSPLVSTMVDDQGRGKMAVTNRILNDEVLNIMRSSPPSARRMPPPPPKSPGHADRATRALYQMDQRPCIPPHHPQMHPMSSAQNMHRLVLDDKLGMFRMSPRSAHTHRHSSSHSTKVGREISPPPQRPCSPDARSGRYSHTVRPVNQQRTDNWLAAGRDVHREVARNQRCKTAKVQKPGWMQGLPPRPKSAAAARASKRTKAPNIITPSSMFCDSLRGRGVIDFCPHAQYQRSLTYSASNAYQPSPAAYAPLRSRRLQLISQPPGGGILCEQCGLHKQQEQQQQLHNDADADDKLLEMVAINNECNNNMSNNNNNRVGSCASCRAPSSTPRGRAKSLSVGDLDSMLEYELTTPLPHRNGSERDVEMTRESIKRLFYDE